VEVSRIGPSRRLDEASEQSTRHWQARPQDNVGYSGSSSALSQQRPAVTKTLLRLSTSPKPHALLQRALAKSSASLSEDWALASAEVVTYQKFSRSKVKVKA